MTAVEVVANASHPDHTVLEEILPGWRDAVSREMIRFAQVRVSRTA
jgi:molecular chaperone GrpE (heat shock protein)